MNNIINLEESITKLFRSAIGDGYNEEEIEEMLADIDFHALSQAIFHNLETVYEYTVDCTLPFAMNYRGLELFPRAAFLYEDAGDCMASLCAAPDHWNCGCWKMPVLLSFPCTIPMWETESLSPTTVSIKVRTSGSAECVSTWRISQKNCRRCASPIMSISSPNTSYKTRAYGLTA